MTLDLQSLLDEHCYDWAQKTMVIIKKTAPGQTIPFGYGEVTGLTLTVTNTYFRSRIAMFFHWLAMKIEGKA